MATPAKGTVDSNTGILAIIWFLGVTVMLFFVGTLYTIPEDFGLVVIHKWSEGIALTGLGISLLLYAKSALRTFLTPKTIKVLDAIVRGLTRLKSSMSGNGPDTNQPPRF